jgi:hypothetical protein
VPECRLATLYIVSSGIVRLVLEQADLETCIGLRSPVELGIDKHMPLSAIYLVPERMVVKWK